MMIKVKRVHHEDREGGSKRVKKGGNLGRFFNYAVSRKLKLSVKCRGVVLSPRYSRFWEKKAIVFFFLPVCFEG